MKCFYSKLCGPHVSLTKTVDKSTVLVGQTVTFTITVFNFGLTSVQNVTIADFLPPGFTFVSASDCTLEGNTVVCRLDNLPVGATIIKIVTIPTTPGTFTNTATLNFNETIFRCELNCNRQRPLITSADITVLPALRITKNVNPVIVSVGSNVIFTITVTNPLSVPVNNIVVTDQIPSNFTVISAPGCVVVGNLVTCNVGTLAPNTSSVITITANAVTVGSYTNTATANYTLNGNPAPPVSGSVSGTINPILPLVITKTGNPQSLPSGQIVTYTITVSNPVGNPTATNIFVVDMLPIPPFIFIDFTNQGFDPPISPPPTNIITATKASLPGGTSISLIIRLRAIGSGSFDNSAALSYKIGGTQLTGSDSTTTQVTPP